MSYRLDFHKDKEIDNGTSIDDLDLPGINKDKKGKTKKNKDTKKVSKKQQRKEIDF